MTLDVDKMRAVCGDVRYRDGWSFRVLRTNEGPMVRIVARVPDARDGAPLDLGIDTYPSPNDMASVDAFLAFLSWRLQRVESHESREYLKHRGVTVNPPGH